MKKFFVFVISVFLFSSFAIASEILDLVNAERVSKGLAVVTEKEELNCAALKHATDIGTRKTCSRVGQDGSNVTKRVQACGWANPVFLGEIVGCSKKNAKTAFREWLKVPSHYAYIVLEDMKFLGSAEKDGYYDLILSL